MKDVFDKYRDDIYAFVVATFARTNEERDRILNLAQICKKYNVSFETFIKISNEFNEVTNAKAD